MRIVTLLENRSPRSDLRCAHGLSLYIEANGRKLLFDSGPNEDFLANAAVLGIDLAAVDAAVLSHGHDDHAGGLDAFCRVNGHAPVYLHRSAFDLYYDLDDDGTRIYAGIDQSFLRHKARYRFTDGVTDLGGGALLFSDVTGDDYHIPMNDSMTAVRNGKEERDDFRHEQNLLLTEGNTAALFTGCAHRGIINILRRAEELLGRTPDAVFGGFHLYNPLTDALPEPALIDGITEELRRRDALYYTGHCTGLAACAHLRAVLGERCRCLSCGSDITL